MASTVLPAEMAPHAATDSRRPLSVEELCFTSAMSCFEGWLKLDPAIGPRTMAYVTRFISKTLDKTQTHKEVRENLSQSVEVWIWLTRDFAAAIPSLTTRSIGPLASLNDPDKGVTPQESTALITKNYPSLKEDLQLLLKLMHVARNLLVVPEPGIPQDLCAAAQFDQMLYQTIILCINVTSKAYDGDVLEDDSRKKLTEITELYKKLLVTCLQQAHNWIAKNDRNKMAFWSTVLFDDDALPEDPENVYETFRPDIAKTEVQNWFERNSRFCDKARQLLTEYEEAMANKGLPPGHLPCISPLAWNWLPEGTVRVRADDVNDHTKITPQWKKDETDKFEQDKAYGRVSREVDTWWLKTRDPNYDEWVVPMPTVEFAKLRTENCKANLVNRYAHSYRATEDEGSIHSAEGSPVAEGSVEQEAQGGHYVHDYNDDMIEEEDIDDDESYGEGPMNGLLTEVPNILDPTQIEALHMIVKSCILDNAGLALSRAGENLQKTRCRMFLALECGRSLLREILVFIAVWEKREEETIFQLTTQIIEAIHHSALLPYAWQSLRIPKDIISPAQTVLLRLVSAMFFAQKDNPPPSDSKEHVRDVKLLHFLFIQFRSRIVPECVALMHLQAEIRNGRCDPADFPVDSWDMERAKDGLYQFLNLLETVTFYLPDMRPYFREWDAVYELINLLQGLEAAVPRKAMVDTPAPAKRNLAPHHPSIPADPDDDDDGYDSKTTLSPHPSKNPPTNTPGNLQVQTQLLRHNGIIPLLNCCNYDGHQTFQRERTAVLLKYLTDGSEDVRAYMHQILPRQPPPQPQGQHPQLRYNEPTALRIDGVAGEVKVRLRAPGEPMPPRPPSIPVGSAAGAAAAGMGMGMGRALPPLASAAAAMGVRPSASSTAAGGNGGAATGQRSASASGARTRPDQLLQDIVALADEAARLAMGGRLDADETEEEEEEEEDEEGEQMCAIF
ncbi:hypothetical protein N0V88_005234 [Collariella sp. IMI 366227]|nr:hypothetical protein N0V88_005234 [Collariella sp. IMI 366227]